jgi:hypothetical protein
MNFTFGVRGVARMREGVPIVLLSGMAADERLFKAQAAGFPSPSAVNEFIAGVVQAVSPSRGVAPDPAAS